MDIKTINFWKSHNSVQNLDTEIIKKILFLFNSSKSYKIKKSKKKLTNNILKNPKLQVAKDKIENKVNLILNKLTKDNIDILINEFINLVNITSIEEYNIIQKTFYFKIINEIKFIDQYLVFIKIIFFIYKDKYNFEPNYFFELIENKIYFDYFDKNYDLKFIFIKDLCCENYRLNNLSLIRKLVNNNIIDSNLLI